MGAWSVHPIGNDTAADWNYGPGRDIAKWVEEGLEDKNPDVIRAAAFLLERTALTYLYDIRYLDLHLDLAIEKLKQLLDDSSWIAQWNDEQEIKDSIRQQISNLQELR